MDVAEAAKYQVYAAMEACRLAMKYVSRTVASLIAGIHELYQGIDIEASSGRTSIC